MEFGEKLQTLRKSRGLTQEELAEALYVSRTAVSKWESGRGYPSIDSLKEISKYFGVTIDDLLSGEKLLSLAESEHRTSLRRICHFLLGMVDMLSLLLIFLPLYPKPVKGYVYSVNLLAYTHAPTINRLFYWLVYLGLFTLGILNICMAQFGPEKSPKALDLSSILLSIAGVVILALAAEVYAVTVVFLLLVIKGFLLYKYSR